MSGARKLATGAAVALLLAFAAFTALRPLSDELSELGVGDRAPEFTARTLDSPPVTKALSDYRGDVVMINIWATWCGPCRVEMPSIEQLHRSYANKGLRVLAVTIDEPGMENAIRDFARELGLTFQILHDAKGDIKRIYRTTGYPETVVIGRDGIIRRKLVGATDWNSPENRALFEHLLSQSAD